MLRAGARSSLERRTWWEYRKHRLLLRGLRWLNRVSLLCLLLKYFCHFMHIARLRLHAQRIFQVNEKRLFSVIRGCFAGRAVRQFNHFDYQTPFTRARLQKLGKNTLQDHYADDWPRTRTWRAFAQLCGRCASTRAGSWQTQAKKPKLVN